MKDYSKIRALAQSILECIGDESEGEDPSLPKQENDFNDGGQEPPADLKPLDNGSTGVSDDSDDDQEKKKKSKDSSIAMMTSMLKSKFGNK